MSRVRENVYAFDDGVPVDPVARGTTLLVAGSALSRANDLALSLVAGGPGNQDGRLFISTNMTCEKLLGACEAVAPTFDSSRTGVVDCSGQDLGQVRFRAQVKTVSTQRDLTGIGIKFSSLYESLYAAAPDGHVRSGLISLSSLSMYVDLRSLFQFAQTISGRVDSAGGLGVFAIDPTAHDDREVNTLDQVADARIQVRESDEKGVDGQLRVRGLPDHDDDWRPFTL